MYWPLIVVRLLGCTPDEAHARKVLEAYGFENIHLGGYPFFGCGNGELLSVEFTATSVKKDAVRGSVCCGIFKNCTVRLR